jgi:hypothetical protein
LSRRYEAAAGGTGAGGRELRSERPDESQSIGQANV